MARDDDDGTPAIIGAVIAPACGAAVAAAGMVAELAVSGRIDLAAMTAGAIAGRVLDLWLPALAFAYPAFIGFFLLAAILNGIGLRGRSVLAVCGGAAGGAGMAWHLYRTYGQDFLLELIGEPLAQASLESLATGFALPAIGILAGMIGGLVFARFAYGRR